VRIRASDAYPVSLCPGKFRACDGLPDYREDDPTRDSGTRVHAADAGEEIDLSDDEEVTLETVKAKREFVSDKLSEGLKHLKTIREKDYAFGNFTGHPDVVEIWENEDGHYVRGLVWDTKTGWREQTEPASNLQVRIYVYLAFMAHPEIDEIYAGLIPSRFKTPPPVLYNRLDLPAIEANLADIWNAANKPDAPRIPSYDACLYCRARATDRCKETIPMNNKLAIIKAESLLATLTPKEKGMLLEECSIIEGNIKIARLRLKQELSENPDAVEGWGLVPGDVRGSIPNAEACYQIVSDFMTQEEFQSSLKVAQKPLKDAIKDYLVEKEGINGKAAAARIKAILAPVTILKQGEDRLERKA
jgi:hypothetical protein